MADARAFVLRLWRDAFGPEASYAPPLPALNRVLYALSGDVVAGSDTLAGRPVAAGAAWHAPGACVARAGGHGAVVLVGELVPAEEAGALWPGPGVRRERLLEHPIDLDPAARYLMRCDRVEFPLGGVAWPHRHRGGGIRCLLSGLLEVTVASDPPRVVRPGEAWFESGREAVLARASATEDTSFLRVSILPREIQGQSSIVYVDPADADRGKPRRYTVLVDEPIETR
jgi:hypothetical protein